MTRENNTGRDELLETVHRMLSSGKSATYIADWIRADKKRLLEKIESPLRKSWVCADAIDEALAIIEKESAKNG